MITPATNPALELIAGLSNTLAEAAKSYGITSGPYALVDFPDFANVGDSVIWAGAHKQLTALLGSTPAYVCDPKNYSRHDLKAALPSGPIFINGGGNFGDLWPRHHTFRERVLEDFPDRRIIQLPQTIHFQHEKYERTAALIRKHKNFILFVRDERSLAIGRTQFACPVHLAPDMGFCLGSIPRSAPPQHRLLFLLRTDQESAAVESTPEVPEGAVVADWIIEDRDFYPKRRNAVLFDSLRTLGLKTFAANKFRQLLYEDLSAGRIDRGLRLLSSAEYVITDRLHCHILCVLLGIPHTVLDNSYGKLSSFIEAWTKSCPFLTIAPSLDEATRLWAESGR